MSVLPRLFDWTWIVTVFVGLLTYFLVNTYVKRRGLPPGPIPLPLIGNLLAFRSKTRVDLQISNWRLKYGDVFTLWMGLDPMVIVCGWDRIKEGLITRKNAFSGRKPRFTNEIFLDGHNDVMLDDFGPRFEALRKLIHSAVRKFSVSDKLPILINDVLTQVVDLMTDKKEPLDPNDFIYLMIYNILASTAFGRRYDMQDEEFLNMKRANDEIQEEFNVGSVVDVFPILQYVLRAKMKRLADISRRFKEPIAKHYKEHKNNFTPGVIRDFTDACLAAKLEAEEEGDEQINQYFTDGNMSLVILDLFSAGSDTTRITMNWTLLYLAQFPEIQEKVRREVLEKIGNRIPSQEDKHKCPYTTAVITEVLRIRPVISFTLEHKAIQDALIDKYTVPKETSIIFHIFSQHMDPDHWKDPETFRPERFLEEDGTFMTTSRFIGYLPFGLGRRACPGEKLALTNLFLILTGFVQKCRFSLPDGADGVDLEPQNILFINLPKTYKLVFEKI